MAFAKDGTVTLTINNIRATGKYKFLSADRVEIEFGGLPLMGSVSMVGEVCVSFPECNRMSVYYPQAGNTQEWRRLQK
jgi:hypothetical protein